MALSAAENSRNIFASQFNELVGSKVGRPLPTYTDAQFQKQDQGALIKAALMMAKKKTTTTKTPKAKVTPVTTPTDAATILGLTTNKGKMNPRTGEVIPDTGTTTSKASSKVVPTGPKVNVKDLQKADRPDIPKESSAGFSLKGLVKGIQHTAGNVAGYIGLSDDEPTSGSGEGDSASAFDFAHQLNQGAATQWTMKNLISRPFDVSNRYGYAVNESLVRSGSQGQGVGGSTQGAISGLEGKSKTSGHDVLNALMPQWAKDNIISPHYYGLLGFGIDTVENPLTFTKIKTIKTAANSTAELLKSGKAALGLDAIKQEFGAAVGEGMSSATHPDLKAVLDKTKIEATPSKVVGTRKVTDVLPPELNKPEFGKYYHGSSDPIPEFQQYTGKSADNLYGPGVYSTDTGSVAGKYTAKGAGKNPNVYRLEWAGDAPPKMLNLERPAPDLNRAVQQFTDGLVQNEWFDTTQEAINKLQDTLANPQSKGKDVYKAFKEMLSDGRMHQAEADDIMYDLNDLMQDSNFGGYDAFAHVGGEITKGQKHGVTVWLDPAKVRIAENVTEQALPKTVTSQQPRRIGGGTTSLSLKDRVIRQTQADLDNMIYEEKSGKVTGGGPKDVHGTLAEAAGEHVRTAAIEDIQAQKLKFIEEVESGKRHTSTEFAKMREDPIFSHWLDAAEEVQATAAKAGQTLSPEDIVRLADKEFPGRLEPMVQDIATNVKANLRNRVLNVPKISMGQHDIYLPRLARMIHDMNLGRAVPENFKRAYLMSSWVPGATSHVSNKIRSGSKLELNAFKENLAEIAQGTTLAERKLIKSATEEDIVLTGKLGEIQQEQVKLYKEMHKAEVDAGVRTEADSPYIANYTFNRIKGGSSKLPDANLSRGWIEPRKESMHATKSSKGWTGADAKNLGLRVEEDFADALVQRKVRSLNKLASTRLTQDLVSHYGIKSSILPHDVFKHDLKKVDIHGIPEWLKKELKPGENVYLHKDIAKVIDDYHELMGFNQSKEARNFVKGLENLTQIYKVANTMYWPGFHMRNMLSDYFMGMLDGVKAKEYTEVFKNMITRDDPNINIGGETFPFSKLKDSYDKNASSGYYDTEMSKRIHPEDMATTRLQDAARNPFGIPGQIKDIAQNAAIPPEVSNLLEVPESVSRLAEGIKNAHQKVANASQAREDFGRLVHYKHAMDEEYAFNRAKGYSKEKSWAKAEEAAQARVNRFKFDYDALTPWEKKLRKYGIPFYTYMRKASPLLLENMLMNPKYFNMMSQMQKKLAPSEEWQNTREPSWQRDQNLSLLTDDSQPWGFTDALNPVRTLTDPFTRPGGLIGGLASQAAPAIQLPFELSSKKDTFTGKPVENVGDFLRNKFKGFGQYSSATGPKDPLEKVAYAAGLPVYHVTDRMQGTKEAELKQTMRDQLVSYNKQLEPAGFRLEISNGKIELVQPKSPTAAEIRDGTTPRYPVNPTRRVRGTYTSFDQIPIKFK
jgi:hypothetical protein